MTTEPIDTTHADSLAYIHKLRRRYDRVIEQVLRWEPRPCPPRPER